MARIPRNRQGFHAQEKCFLQKSKTAVQPKY